MRHSVVAASLFASAIALGSVLSLAQPTPPAAGAQPKPGAQPAAPAGPKGPLKDPQGVRGISPFMEQIAKGKAAFVARDFAGAVTAFQEAVKLDSEQMLGFYMLGQAQLAAGKPEEAEAVWKTAVNKKGPEDLQAKVKFVLADLRERQAKLPEAKDEWGQYASYVQSNAKANGYAGTPTERQKQIDRRVKDEKDYAPVKERIKKRQEEREKEAAENAKKDKGNK